MSRFWLVAVVSCVIAVSGRAHAEKKDKCNGVAGIAPEDLAACNDYAYQRCRPSYRENCLKGVYREYRRLAVKRVEDQKKAKEREAEAACDTEPFVSQCEKAKAYEKEVCSQTGSLGEAGSELNQRWHDIFRRAPEAKAYWAEFAPKYPQCHYSRFKCSFSEFDKKSCAEVEANFRKMWDNWFRLRCQLVMEGAKAAVAKLAKNPLDPFSVHAFEEAETALKEAHSFQDVAYLHIDAKQLDQWDAWIASEKAKWQQNRDKALAKVKCPRAKNRNAKMTKRMRKVLVAHLADTEVAGSTMKETVVRFGLSGKARRKREALRRITHEDLPGFACVRQEKDGQTTCRIFQMTFRRSKPDGGSFGPWAFYSIGGGGEMLCRNLK